MSDLDSIIINLRACLVSIKGGVPLNQLESKFFGFYYFIDIYFVMFEISNIY